MSSFLRFFKDLKIGYKVKITLEEYDMILNESGIRLPKNTKSCKILTHRDLDGFFSGLLLYNQLIRQGIPADHIEVKFVQYGENDLLDKATRKNKFQAVLSSDFAGYPKVEMKTSFNGFAKTHDKEHNKFTYPVSYEQFKSELLDKKPSFSLLSNWLREKNPEALLFTKPKDSSMRKSLNDFMLGWKNYKDDDDVVITDFDYVSDHHDNSKGELISGKSGRIGKTEYRSDTEHIATVAAQNLMNWDDIEVVSRIDSASYNDIHNTMTLSHDFHGKDRKERLGILTNALVSTLLNSNERLAVHLLKISKPSLISVYNNALKVVKLNDIEVDIMDELKSEHPDWNKINELTAKLPKSESKKILQDREENKKIKKTMSFDSMRQKNDDILKREMNLDESDFKFIGNTSVFKARDRKNQPGRYVFAFLKREGKFPVFNVRDFSEGNLGMIQFSASPFVSSEDKEKIDLVKLGEDALNAAKAKGILPEFAYEVIKKQSGGHKTIMNISGLGIISNTALSPNERYDLKAYKDYETRRKALTNKAVKKALLGYRAKAIKELDAKKSASKREVADFLIDYIVKELNSRYSNIKVNPSIGYEVK